MSFDLRAYAREREKKKQTNIQENQDTQNGTFDLKEYARRRRARQVSEGLVGRINMWFEDNDKYVSRYNSRFVGRDNSTYVSDSNQWMLDSMEQKNSLDKEREGILSDIEKYGQYMNPDWVKSVTEALKGSDQTQGNILDVAKQDRDFWKKFDPTEEQKVLGVTAESLYQDWYKDDTYRQKHQGKTYGQIQELIAGMEDGEEKTWLMDNAASFMTAEDYDNELVKVDQKIEALQAELHQMVNVGGTDYFTKDEISRSKELQRTIAELSHKY